MPDVLLALTNFVDLPIPFLFAHFIRKDGQQRLFAVCFLLHLLPQEPCTKCQNSVRIQTKHIAISMQETIKII